MTIGSVLVGVALVVAVASYLIRPFRVARSAAERDREIETWVAQVRAERLEAARPMPPRCGQCGRPADSDAACCAGCGTRLPGADR
jgi:tRNA(Ile2) C34 agmatinyltransferase TiaS